MHASLKLVYNSVSNATSTSLEPLAIVATAEPSLFLPRFLGPNNCKALTYDSSEAVLEALKSGTCTHFIADYRQLEDRWSGMRFLRHFKESGELANMNFWLMANTWLPQQEEIAVKNGAHGFIKRNRGEVLAKLGSKDVHATRAYTASLDLIDELFAEFSGSVDKLQIERARLALPENETELGVEAYSEKLAKALNDGQQQTRFLQSVQVLKAKPKPALTQSNEEWFAQINRIYQAFAGALGAKLVILGALENYSSHNDSDQYLNELAEQLSNPTRRQEFLLKAKNFNK
jgi:hypothetical protein